MDLKGLKDSFSIVFPTLDRFGPLFQQSAWILVCLLFAKLIGVFAQARAALYLGAEHYGISGIFYGLAPLILLFTNMRTDIVLVREYPEREKSGSIRKLISYVFSFRLLLLVLILLIAGTFFVQQRSYLWCWVLAAPFYASQALRPYWLIQARRQLHLHYFGMLVQTVVTAACIFFFFRPGQFMGSDLIAYGTGGLAAMLITWKCIHRGIPEIQANREMAQEMSNLVLGARWVLLTALLSMIYTSLEMPLISLLRSEDDAGTYRTAVSLSESIYTFMTFLNAILYPYLVLWNRRGPGVLWRMQLRILGLFMILGGMAAGLTYAFAPFIYDILYEGAYREAIHSFRLLVIAKVFMLLAGIFSWGFMARKQDKALLAILAPLSIGALVTACFTIPSHGITASASVALTFSFLFFTLTFGTSWFQIHRSKEKR
jgi:O-antigen/teichoic acid export membrane protein